MCGLFGVVSANLPSEAEFCRALATIRHRGPDVTGVARYPGVLLGHQRLSIIDLSDASNQPFEAEHSVLVYNGEVYNFKELRRELIALGVEFRTSGDTEVVSKAYEMWGPSCFERLHGMYALAIYDRRTGEVHLARDPFGIKPLYYRRIAGGWAFASEIKPLLALERSGVAWPTLLDVCVWGFPLSYQSFFDGVRQLPAGSTGTIQQGEIRIRGDQRATMFEGGDGEDQDRLGAVLRSSVEHHMISDAPMAIALSGGLDSSIVAALAGPTVAITTTFTEEEDWEVEHARAVAKHCGLTHEVLRLEVGDFEHLLADVVYHLEEPITNPNIFPSYGLGRALHGEGYKVVLMGEGSDELFAGYPWHVACGSLSDDPHALYAYYRLRRGQGHYGAYLTSDALALMNARNAWALNAFLHEQRRPGLTNMLSFDQAYQLQFSQLSRVDRMMMAHSVEARVPFLYEPVARASNALPDSAKISVSPGRNSRDNKIALSQAIPGLIPEKVVNRPKFGAGGTVNLWSTPLFRDLPQVMERLTTADEYRQAREVLEPWIDWSKVSMALGVKQALHFALLIMTCHLHVLGNEPPRDDSALRVA